MGVESKQIESQTEPKEKFEIELDPYELTILTTLSNIFEEDPTKISNIVEKIIKKEIKWIKQQTQNYQYEFFLDYLEGSQLEQTLLDELKKC
jgi:hypothetical protein